MEDDVIEELDTFSPELKTELAQKLYELMPETYQDGKINFHLLEELLADDTSKGVEPFGLMWPGKAVARQAALTPTSASLKPIENMSQDWDSTKNVFIEGDNLQALKLLQNSYRRSIKMIYIDPPYNKEKDFIYPDKYTEDLATYLAYSGQVSDDGEKLESQTETAGRRHSKWLSMMYPRLQLAKSLLTMDGLIFISIDDIEIGHLLTIMNEVFGEENRVSIFKWNKTSTPPSLSKKVRHKYEYVVCYQRSNSGQTFNGGISSGGDMPLLNEGNAIGDLIFPKSSIVFNFDGTYPAGKYDRVELLEPIEIKNGVPATDVKLRGPFKWRADNLKREISEGTSFIIKSEKFAIRYIREGERFKKPSDIISKTECGVGTNEDGGKEIEELFGGVNPMSYPKPTTLIQFLARFTTSDDDIILDFFSGSGTTAQAVMQLNIEDEGNRRFIQVQLPEPTYTLDENGKEIPTKEGKVAYDLGFKTISDLAIERIKRASQKLVKDNQEKIKNRATPLDCGLRVYSLSASNFKTWPEATAIVDPVQAVLDFADNFSRDASPDDLFIEILLRSKLRLDTTYALENLASGGTVYVTDHNELVAYVDSSNITIEQAKEILAKSPKKFVVIDAAFNGQDDLKINIANMCKESGISEFKTI